MIKIDKLNPFGRLCITLGMLPSSYKESLTYEEQLLWMLNYIEKTLIPTINNNAQAVEELQALYLELKSYVDNYFTNLDVQQEINNKLDQMAESGQLTNIIAQYLGLAGVLAFNTVNDMINAENIVNGSICKCVGKLNYNDGYGAFYKIRNVLNTDIVDNETIYAITNNNNLVAELIINSNVGKVKDELENQIESSVIYPPSFILANLFQNSGNNHNEFYVSQNGLDFAKIKTNFSFDGRDLSLCYNKVTKKFYIIAGASGQIDFVILESSDFINWNSHNVTVGLNFTNKWAWDIFADDDGSLIVTVSCSNNTDGATNIYGASIGTFDQYIMKSTSLENYTFTTPSKLTLISNDDTDLVHNYYIDGTFNKINNTYYLAIKNEYYDRIQLFSSNDLNTFTSINDNVFSGCLTIEAPSLVFTEGKAYMYGEDNVDGFYLVTSCDLSNFPTFNRKSKILKNLISLKHGSFSFIDDNNAKKLIMQNSKVNFVESEELETYKNLNSYAEINNSTTNYQLNNFVPLPYKKYIITESNNQTTTLKINNIFDLDTFDIIFATRQDKQIIITHINGVELTQPLTINNSSTRNEKLIRIPLRNIIPSFPNFIENIIS